MFHTQRKWLKGAAAYGDESQQGAKKIVFLRQNDYFCIGLKSCLTEENVLGVKRPYRNRIADLQKQNSVKLTAEKMKHKTKYDNTIIISAQKSEGRLST